MNIMVIYSTIMTCGTVIGAVGWTLAISFADKIDKLKEEITSWRCGNAYLRGKKGAELRNEEIEETVK